MLFVSVAAVRQLCATYFVMITARTSVAVACFSSIRCIAHQKRECAHLCTDNARMWD
jgi:hypothetical protein